MDRKEKLESELAGINQELEWEGINYHLDEMPNCTKMVGDVASLTYDAGKLLDGTNEGFIAAEKLIREHVWQEAQRAHKAALDAIEPELRPEVFWFATKMEEKLRENDGKGGWKGSEFGELMGCIEEELEELDYAYTVFNRRSDDVVDECVDVANFAMMIADNTNLPQGGK